MHGKTIDVPEERKALPRAKASQGIPIKAKLRVHRTTARGDTLRAKGGAAKDTLLAKAPPDAKEDIRLAVKAEDSRRAKAHLRDAKEGAMAKDATHRAKAHTLQAAKAAQGGKGTGHTRAARGDTLHARWSAASSAGRREKADTRSRRSRTTGADTTAP